MIQKLKNKELNEKLISLTHEERRIGIEILNHLQEVMRRRLYVDLGYKDIYSYCRKVLCYSEGQIYRRLNAVKALREIPEAAEDLQSGRLNVSTLSLFQSFTKGLDVETKRPLLTQLHGLSREQVERTLYKALPATKHCVTPNERKRVVSADLTEYRITLTEAQVQKLELAKGRLAHKLKGHTLSTLLETMADHVIKSTDPKPPKRSPESTQREQRDIGANAAVNATAKSPMANPFSRTIAKSIKFDLFTRAKNKCELCKSTYALQIDHVLPVARGGETTKENLRVLCRTCNLNEAHRWGIART